MMAASIADSAQLLCVPSSERTTSRHWLARSLIAAALLLAFCLRIGVAVRYTGIDWSDETYQSIEPAHHLVYGNWIKTWEYQRGARSWVFPAFLSLVIRATAWLGSGSSGYLLGIQLVLSLFSLLPVYFAIRWAARIGGLPAACISACTAVTWYQLIYYAPKPLNDVVAADFLLPGLYLLFFAAGKKRQLLLGGVLCGLALALRMQLAPVIAVAIVLLVLPDFRAGAWHKKLSWLALGVAIPVLVFGLVDAFTWSYPFQSYWENFRANAAFFRTNPFGTEPFYWYATQLLASLSALSLFVVIGARRAPFLGWIVLALIVPHSLIPHKEFRFLAPVLPILLLLSSIGLAEVVNVWSMGRQPSRLRFPLVILACFFCVGLSSSLARHFPKWNSRGGYLTLSRMLSQDSSTCAVAILPDKSWSVSGGYAYLHRHIPVYAFPSIREAWSSRAAFNALVVSQSLPGYFAGFSLSQCSQGVCLYRRSGTCTPQTAFELNSLLQEPAKP